MAASGVIVSNRRRPRHRSRRRRLLTRALPVLVLGALAFLAGIEIALQPGRDEHALVAHYVSDWARGDYRAMYALLDGESHGAVSEAAFVAQLQEDARIATLRSLRVVRVGSAQGSAVPVSMVAQTVIWGRLRESLLVPFSGGGSGARVRFGSELLFPGLRPGETLHRHTVLPPRATLLAVDGTVLAQGPELTSPDPAVADQIVGSLQPIPASLRAAYAAQGYPPDASVGYDGLELAFQSRLAGEIGGTLEAGDRVLAAATPVQAPAVRTTIDPTLEQAAITAQGGKYSGIAVLDPRTGAVEALAGIAYSALQPPGSTMKIITSTAALQAGLVKLTTVFPYATAATIDGFTMHNADNEDCGGTLLLAFAVSCNSVFAPLGVQVGAARLTATADRFGFNQPPSIPGAAESVIPQPIGSDLAVGSSAIGQDLVQTTPLEMADVAATIAMGGRRPIPTLLAGQRPRFVRVTSGRVAREVQQMMVAVVQEGTGTSAQIPGVQVAGKTGTAEIHNSVPTAHDNPKNTDAWFVAYAPVGRARIVAGALFPAQGFGAATAAPAVRQVLIAALEEHQP